MTANTITESYTVFNLMPSGTWRIQIFFILQGRSVYFLFLILALMKVQEISKPQMGFSKKNWHVKTVIRVYFKYLRVSLVLTENTRIGFHLLEMFIFSRDKHKFYWNWSMIYFGMRTAEQSSKYLDFLIS